LRPSTIIGNNLTYAAGLLNIPSNQVTEWKKVYPSCWFII